MTTKEVPETGCRVCSSYKAWKETANRTRIFILLCCMLNTLSGVHQLSRRLDRLWFHFVCVGIHNTCIPDHLFGGQCQCALYYYYYHSIVMASTILLKKRVKFRTTNIIARQLRHIRSYLGKYCARQWDRGFSSNFDPRFGGKWRGFSSNFGLGGGVPVCQIPTFAPIGGGRAWQWY